MKEENILLDKPCQILDAAEILFAENDFDAVSVREIAQAAEVNVAMISYYFGSKEKMFLALIESRIAETRSAIREISNQNISPFEKLEGIMNVYVDKMLGNRKFQRIITRELFQNNRPEVNQFIIENIGKNRQELFLVITDGIKKKVFKKVDVEMTIMSLISTVVHITAACKHTQFAFQKSTEVELYTTQFKKRLKTHLKELLHNHLSISTEIS